MSWRGGGKLKHGSWVLQLVPKAEVFGCHAASQSSAWWAHHSSATDFTPSSAASDFVPAGSFSPDSPNIYLYAHANLVNGIDPSGHFEMNVSGLLAGMTVKGHLAGVGISYFSGKLLDVGMQVVMFQDLSQVEFDWYEHWDLLNLIPEFAIERTWSKMARYLRKLEIVGKHKGALTEARKLVPLADNGFRECEVVSATLAEKLGAGAATRLSAGDPKSAKRNWQWVIRNAHGVAEWKLFLKE